MKGTVGKLFMTMNADHLGGEVRRFPGNCIETA